MPSATLSSEGATLNRVLGTPVPAKSSDKAEGVWHKMNIIKPNPL